MAEPQSNPNIFKKVERKISSKGPKSLYFRFLLITIAPVLLIQLVTIYTFYSRHWESLSRNMTATLTGETAMIINGLTSVPEEKRTPLIMANNEYLGLQVSVDKNKKLDITHNINERYPELVEALQQKINAPLALFNEHGGRLRFGIQIDDDVINIIFTDKRIINPSTYIFIMWVLGSALFLSIISVLFMRGQVRSILSLSSAAEHFGKGSELQDFKPSGAREIRRAGVAFIEMKERIKRLIDTRTQMLAGVSHDIRTPLTRMKLITSMLADKSARLSLEQEVDEMSKMIEGYLSFAELEISRHMAEPIQSVNLKTFIESITSRYVNFSNEVRVMIPDNIYLNIRPIYLKRAFSNLIDNAIKYSSQLFISARIENAGEENESVLVNFEDNGPGIPEDKLEQVFQPFYRLDESRNSETGGVGLGLSITRDIINKHGGDIKLSRSSIGGLKATVILPK